jgi:NADPH:quinone reductase-like Zn-dependent oxidoreductase
LRALGATVVVADGDTPEARAALAEAVGPGGAQAVYDAVAGDAGALALSALADGGTHVVYGALSREALPVAPAALIYRAATVRGLWRTRWVSETPVGQVREAVGSVAALAAEGVFDLPVEATFDLADVAESVRAATARGRWGKVLLTG